jgi:hypothetical protein
MSNFHAKTGAGDDAYLKASGAGTDIDPHVPEHLESNSADILTAAEAVQAAVEGSLTVDLGATDNAVLDSIATNTTDAATQTTLAALLAKIIAAPSTEAKQDTVITALGSLLTELQGKADTAEAQAVDATGQGDVPITLDGEEITANLGATDNAVIDAIAASLAAELTVDLDYIVPLFAEAAITTATSTELVGTAPPSGYVYEVTHVSIAAADGVDGTLVLWSSDDANNERPYPLDGSGATFTNQYHGPTSLILGGTDISADTTGTFTAGVDVSIQYRYVHEKAMPS